MKVAGCQVRTTWMCGWWMGWKTPKALADEGASAWQPAITAVMIVRQQS
jgi:hypothetical protein